MSETTAELHPVVVSIGRDLKAIAGGPRMTDEGLRFWYNEVSVRPEHKVNCVQLLVLIRRFFDLKAGTAVQQMLALALAGMSVVAAERALRMDGVDSAEAKRAIRSVAAELPAGPRELAAPAGGVSLRPKRRS